MKSITRKIIATLLLTLALVSCSAMFENRIPKNNNANIMALTNLVVPPVTIERLDAPQQIFVSKAEFANKIRITWSSVDYATSYCLERAVSTEKDVNGNFIQPDESAYEILPLASKVYATTYEDVILIDPSYLNEEYGYEYFYRVCAENPRLKYESSEYINSEGGYLLAPPTQVVASLGEYSDKIIVSWKKSQNAKSYDIYRSRNPDGSSSVKIGNVSGNLASYTNSISSNDQGVDYYFTVKTITSTSESVSSSIALGYGKQDGAPSKVKNVRVKEGAGRGDGQNIEIEWEKTEGLYYAVYRTSSKDSSYTLLSKKETGNSYKDTKSLKPNVFYYYQIQAYTGETENEIVKGPFSDSGPDAGIDVAAEGFILGAPADIKVIKTSSDKCMVQFIPSLGSIDNSNDSKLSTKYNHYSYQILGSTTENGSYTVLKTVEDSTLSINDEGYYTETDVPLTKFYKIKTLKESKESPESAVCAPVPFAAKNLKVTKAEFIAGITLDGADGNDANAKGYANENGIFPVKLTWDPPSENDADGGYFIYRSTKKTSGFKKLNDEPIMNTSYIYSDETAKAGIYYYYKVLSLNSLKQGANYSNTDYGYGALTANQYMREYNKTVINSQKGLKLMHMADDMKKLGSESTTGKLSGSLSYSASVQGLGARILMHYTNYADYWANNNTDTGKYYFFLNGDTNTSASMDASGTMDGTVTCTGMYPGSVGYNNLKIKGGAAGGGSYAISRQGFGNTINVNWEIGEEGK